MAALADSYARFGRRYGKSFIPPGSTRGSVHLPAEFDQKWTYPVARHPSLGPHSSMSDGNGATRCFLDSDEAQLSLGVARRN